MSDSENGLFSIPDYDGLEDEAFPPLPPPHSPGQGGDDGDPFGNDEENGEVSKLADVPAAKRKSVKRPQPKLDSQRLTSDRGLPALRTLFENVRFKGKGHEAEDLKLLMQRMENWAHRLFPKLQFEDFIDRVEKLGNKKEVQTCLKRIRLDMPLTHEDFMGEDEPPPEPQLIQDLDPFDAVAFPDDLQRAIHSTPAPASPPAFLSSPAAPSLTEEQRARMELNRQKALERKLARQRQQTDPSSSQTVNSSTPSDEATSVSSANILSTPKAQDEEEDMQLEPDSSSTRGGPEEPQKQDQEEREGPQELQKEEPKEQEQEEEQGREEEQERQEELQQEGREEEQEKQEKLQQEGRVEEQERQEELQQEGREEEQERQEELQQEGREEEQERQEELQQEGREEEQERQEELQQEGREEEQERQEELQQEGPKEQKHEEQQEQGGDEELQQEEPAELPQKDSEVLAASAQNEKDVEV